MASNDEDGRNPPEITSDPQQSVKPAEPPDQNHRLDSSKYMGLRQEMAAEAMIKTNLLVGRLTLYGEVFVSFAIFANALAMGASIQMKKKPDFLWYVLNHVFTAIFASEMLCKLHASKLNYFKRVWNLIDFFVTNLSIFSYWIIPLFSLEFDMGVLTVLRLLRLLRVVRLLRINRALESLVEGLLVSLQSLIWSLLLLLIISYIFALLASQLIDPPSYFDDIGDDIVDHFDAEYYFGDVAESVLTLFNMCLLAEWVEIIRPVWFHQPYLVVILFIPYLMLCTFGVLNLIIGVIAENTLEKMAAEKEEREAAVLRDKMKTILRMTDEMYESDSDGVLTKEEFLTIVHRHPDFLELMRKCDFPRGFHVEHLHTIFDDSGDGNVEKPEFVNGMFRLAFNSLPQHAATLLLNLSQLKHDLHERTGRRLDELAERLERRLDQLAASMPVALTPRDPGSKPNRPEEVSGSDQAERDRELASERLPAHVQLTPDALHEELRQLEAKLQQAQDQLKQDLVAVLHSSLANVQQSPGALVPKLNLQEYEATRSATGPCEVELQHSFGDEFQALGSQLEEHHAILKKELLAAIMPIQRNVAWLVPLVKTAISAKATASTDACNEGSPAQSRHQSLQGSPAQSRNQSFDSHVLSSGETASQSPTPSRGFLLQDTWQARYRV